MSTIKNPDILNKLEQLYKSEPSSKSSFYHLVRKKWEELDTNQKVPTRTQIQQWYTQKLEENKPNIQVLEKVLNESYNPSTIAYLSPQSLYNYLQNNWTELKKKNDGLPSKPPKIGVVRKFVSEQPLQNLFSAKPVKHYMPVSSFQRLGPFQRAQMDIMFPPGQKMEENKSCLLILIDTFSRYAFAEAIHKRDEEFVIKGFKEIMNKLNELNIIPAGMQLNSDMEKAFLSGGFNNAAEKYGIELIPNTFANDHKSLAFVDSFIGTFRNSLNKIQRYFNTSKWVEHVKNWIDLYNKQPHQAFTGPLLPEIAKRFKVSDEVGKKHNISPHEILTADPESKLMRLAQALDASRIELLARKAKQEPWFSNEIKEGDMVYIPKKKNSNFEKNSLQKWQTDPVQVTKVEGDSNPVFFYVNKDNNKIKYRKYQLKKASTVNQVEEPDRLVEAQQMNRSLRKQNQIIKELEIDDNVYGKSKAMELVKQHLEKTTDSDETEPRYSTRSRQNKKIPILIKNLPPRRSTRLNS